MSNRGIFTPSFVPIQGTKILSAESSYFNSASQIPSLIFKHYTRLKRIVNRFRRPTLFFL
jgi:hypothetical protein